jgi:subtilase family serine protease
MADRETSQKDASVAGKNGINWWLIVGIIVVVVILVIIIWWWQSSSNCNQINPGSDAQQDGYSLFTGGGITVAQKRQLQTTAGAPLAVGSYIGRRLPANRVPNASAASTSPDLVIPSDTRGTASVMPVTLRNTNVTTSARATTDVIKPAIRKVNKHNSVSAYTSKAATATADANSSRNSPYTPQQVLAAYTTNVAPNGTGKKVAIILAYNYSGLQADLDAFCTTYGLPKKTLIIHNMQATTESDEDWQIEANLDTQYCTLMAPNASIYVVFAASASSSDLNAAVSYALTTIKPDVLSMSWGMDETTLSSVSSFETTFAAAGTNTFLLAASGDALSVSYPSTSDKVIAVGGTTLVMNGTTRAGEYSWDDPDTVGSGEGLSTLFLKPSYQANTNSSSYRATPDISLMSSNPAETGVAVVHQGSIYGVSGTSLATPLFAGILASALSVRTSPLTQATLLNKLYSVVPPITSSPLSPLQGIGAVNQNIIPYIRSI